MHAWPSVWPKLSSVVSNSVVSVPWVCVKGLDLESQVQTKVQTNARPGKNFLLAENS